MMRYAAAISFYNDLKGLKRCIESISKHVDFIIAVDGRYRNFAGKTPLSTDGSREFVLECPNAVLMDMPDVFEFQKRDRYMKMAGILGIDVLIIIDTDEYVMDAPFTLWDDFKAQLPAVIKSAGQEQETGSEAHDIGNRHIFKVMYQDALYEHTKRLLYWPRIIYRPGDFTYQQKHYEFTHVPTGVHLKHSASYGRKIAPSIMFASDYATRSEDYLNLREDYQHWLISYEEGSDLRHLRAQQNPIVVWRPNIL